MIFDPSVGAGLDLLADELATRLETAGMPRDAVSGFAAAQTLCEVHPAAVGVDVRFSPEFTVRVVHCGCEEWFHRPAERPCADAGELADGLAAEILWYLDKLGDAETLALGLRDALEREMAKGRSEGLDWTLLGISPAPFETFRGRRIEFKAKFDLLHNSLLVPATWERPFGRVDDVARFFRSMRPYQRALSKRRDALAEVGARTSIDKVAADAMRAAGINPLEIVASYPHVATSVGIDLGHTTLRIMWHLGVLQGELELAPDVRWEFGKVHLVRTALPPPRSPTWKRPLDTFVDAPSLPKKAIIRTTYSGTDHVVLHVEPELEFIALQGRTLTWLPDAARCGSPRALRIFPIET